VAQQGERFMVTVRNPKITSAVDFRCMGLNEYVAPPTGVGRFFNALGAGGSKSSYSSSAMASAAQAAVPWAMLAVKNVVPDDQSHSDPFSRVTLGSLWVPVSNTGSNKIGITSERAAFKGSTNGDQVGLYLKSVAGDQMLVEANIYSRVTTPRLGIMSCCNRELTAGVYLGVNDGTANLYTGAWNSLTQQKTVSVTTGDAKWGLYNDPSTSTFYIIRDDTDIDSWVDTGGVVTLDRDHRFGGIRISRASGVNAGTLDNFTFRDFAR
jgi:hypothetical protein